jgi:hypothetical protein
MCRTVTVCTTQLCACYEQVHTPSLGCAERAWQHVIHYTRRARKQRRQGRATRQGARQGKARQGQPTLGLADEDVLGVAVLVGPAPHALHRLAEVAHATEAPEGGPLVAVADAPSLVPTRGCSTCHRELLGHAGTSKAVDECSNQETWCWDEQVGMHDLQCGSKHLAAGCRAMMSKRGMQQVVTWRLRVVVQPLEVGVEAVIGGEPHPVGDVIEGEQHTQLVRIVGLDLFLQGSKRQAGR